MIHSLGGDTGWWVQFSPLLCTSSCCLSQGGRCIEKGWARGRAPPRWVHSTAGSRCQAGWCCPGAGRAEGGPLCWTPNSQEAAAHRWRKADIDTYKNTHARIVKLTGYRFQSRSKIWCIPFKTHLWETAVSQWHQQVAVMTGCLSTPVYSANPTFSW